MSDELRRITQKELDEIIERHQHYLREDYEGCESMRADLSGTDLSGLNFSYADMRFASFNDAVIHEATFCCTQLNAAAFVGADLRESDFHGASLPRADFRSADVSECSFEDAILYYADFRLAKNPPYIPLACPETGGFIGYKKAITKVANKERPSLNHLILLGHIFKTVIVTLEIPADAKRSSATSRKCRCDKAKAIDIRSIDGSEQFSEARSSLYAPGLTYRIGETVSVDDFDEDRWNECSTGIHFFINRQEAVDF